MKTLIIMGGSYDLFKPARADLADIRLGASVMQTMLGADRDSFGVQVITKDPIQVLPGGGGNDRVWMG